jgi:hypothetical protein
VVGGGGRPGPGVGSDQRVGLQLVEGVAVLGGPLHTLHPQVPDAVPVGPDGLGRRPRRRRWCCSRPGSRHRAFGEPWPLDAWPEVETRFLLATDDRFFPADFVRSTVTDRLGFRPEEMRGDHCPMLGHPKELADRLEAYRTGL